MSTQDDELVHFAAEQRSREAVYQLFRQVETQLRTVVHSADIQHVGSTAIPGSLTKGDLDVQVRVAGSEYSEAKEKLSEIYAVNPGGFASEDAISFEDYSTQPPLGVHLTVIGGTADIQWKFRDLLIESADLREQYDRLKRQFEGGSMERYREAKAEFVSRVLQSSGG
ncbi:MAG TPA: GrpB family protein [Longimicrobium sp.]|nr:GrpB family protein [Longimicrobium sp.]